MQQWDTPSYWKVALFTHISSKLINSNGNVLRSNSRGLACPEMNHVLLVLEYRGGDPLSLTLPNAKFVAKPHRGRSDRTNFAPACACS